MNPFLAIFLVLLLAASSYAAGRLHGQLSYRIGYRFGYRQGYFDGERGAWNRRRQETPASFASVLAVPPTTAPDNTSPLLRQGTTYTGATFAGTATNGGRHSTEVLVGWNA